MYKFQPKPELIWALVVTAATTLAQFATAADPAVVLNVETQTEAIKRALLDAGVAVATKGGAL